MTVGEAAWDEVGVLNSQSMDAQMAFLSLSILTDGLDRQDRLFYNAQEGLSLIWQKSLPVPLSAKIVSVNNVVKGGLNVFGYGTDWFATDAFSEVVVQNDGPTESSFELTAAYERKFTTVDLLPGIPKAGLLERSYDIGSIEVTRDQIPSGAQKTLIVNYMKNKQGTIPKGDIAFSLTATSGATVYGLQTETTRFGTTLIAQNGQIISGPDAEELRMRINPITSHVEHVGPGPRYNLVIQVTNPFDFPVDAKLVQRLPLEIAQASVEGKAQTGQDVSWEFNLDSMNPWTGVITLSFWTEPLNSVQIPPAVLSIYDRINDAWVEFQTEDISL